jgi:hypothetical protein
MANEYYVIGKDKSSAPAYKKDEVYNKAEINDKINDINESLNDKAKKSDVTELRNDVNNKLDEADIQNYVPKTTTINGKALSGPITLDYNSVGAAQAVHNHDDIYYRKENINSKIDTFNSKIDKKADAGSLFSVTSEHSLSWVDDSSFDNGGYYKITVPDCPLGKIQICDFTYNREFEREEEIQFHLPPTNHQYYVFSDKVATENGAYKSSFVGAYANGGSRFDWATFSKYIGYGSANHYITVVYARVS